ncbi:DUF2189 domain-containing protein [Inquilinus sp. CAU 1745]|uniref:DUF2189 domain-containing protein n=1 Tax=Inquilinus sp. CAU 1745 TaxID=3140369 RepID=UPI00325BD949
MTIRNPLEWGADQLKSGAHAVRLASGSVYHAEDHAAASRPEINRIGIADLKDALAKGLDDFAAHRTDVVYVCLIYPVVGLVLARAAFGYDMLPLLFPLASGFALVGSFAAVGLYEMSRRREQGLAVTWTDAVGVLGSPSFGAILVLGLAMLAIFVLWLFAAQLIYMATLGPEPPASMASFVEAVFTTQAGWAMIGVGVGVGFLFAVLSLAVSVVAFPMLIDRKVGVDIAVWTSVRAVAANPIAMGAWGLIVVGGLVLGSLPLFIGLAIVMPVLGHATWHLYRKVVEVPGHK